MTTTSDARKRNQEATATPTTTPDAATVAAVERVLRANGLSEQPGQYDSDIHSWRCSYPEMYGPCSCFQELRDELAALRPGAE